MKKTLCILLFCALLLTGCGVEPANIVNDVEKDEPIRIVATIQSSVPVTATPVVTLPPTVPPTPAPTDTPAPTATPTPALTDTPAPTAEPEQTPEAIGGDVPDMTAVPTAVVAATPNVSQAEQFILIAQKYLNYPYARGGKSPKGGFDPGGFVYWCLNEMGVSVKRRTSAGYAEEESWEKITRFADIQPGDLLFFRTGDNENINCVCIYLGNHSMIYPSTSRGVVIIANNINPNSYWTNAFQWARRVF